MARAAWEDDSWVALRDRPMNPVEAKRGIIQEWLKRPASARLHVHIPVFYGELIESGSAFLSFHGREDRYERIKKWLSPYMSS
jgi:hypothetical protein